MTTLTALFFSILIRLGCINSEADYHRANAQQQEQWKKEIVEDETWGF